MKSPKVQSDVWKDKQTKNVKLRCTMHPLPISPPKASAGPPIRPIGLKVELLML